ncbi:cation transporter [Gallionella capsiferriformans]|jgi:cation diffusion facilitator family transporter|uniref:Cation efflux protein n=2 Tax=Gallionella TaxID=96 RepID=D9SDB4_GALCS|nr:cation transporter [Gallionella capsiferriformans]ADL56712.1 cation efflux protein [Gallionella capsiferriformans ES-2]
MADCCNDKACEIDALRYRQSSTLKIVLGINAVMFVVELTAGLLGNSISLVADSLDMLGDAMVYGFSLYVVARSATMKARAALLKGIIMAAFGFFVLGQVIYRIAFPQLPVYEAIGAIGLLALAANGTCFFLLWRHRADDINMSSVWLCSRNDIIANISVLFAAVGVWLTHSGWPDILVGLALAALFLRSALHVLRESIRALRAIRTNSAIQPDNFN